MSEDTYDIAQICLNGHVINPSYSSLPQFNQKFCDKCGTPTITNCKDCNTPIKGHYHGHITVAEFKPPSFCHECGKPYPWTKAKLKAAKELVDLLEDLSPEERETLKKSLDDIIRDTPRTPVAANQFKRLTAKVGKAMAEELRKLVVDITSETAYKILTRKQGS